METTPPTTIEELTAPFEAHLRRRQASEATVSVHTRGLRYFATWYEGTHGTLPKMASLTATEINEYRQHLRTCPTTKTGQPRKPATIDAHMNALRAYYAYLCEQDETLRNPMARIKYEKKAAPTAPKSLSDKQLGKLFAAAENRIAVADSKRKPCDMTPSACEARRDVAMVATLGYAGLRVSELCALTIDDITLAPRSGTVVVRQGKGEKYREVELSPAARKTLSQWLQWRKHYVTDEACKTLFMGRRGPMKVRAVELVVSKLAKAAQTAGLDAEVSPHTLRHTFARRAVEDGAALVDVQNLMGHESIVTTSRYTKPSKAQRQALVDRLDVVY